MLHGLVILNHVVHTNNCALKRLYNMANKLHCIARCQLLDPSKGSAADFALGRCSVRISTETLTILTEVFRDFLQYLQEIARIVLRSWRYFHHSTLYSM
jgi:hypothetical protein